MDPVTPTPGEPPVVPAPGEPPVVPGAVPTNPTPIDPKIEMPEFTTIIPESLKDKPWAQEIKDVNGLFEKADWALTKVGERPAGIPQESAPQEDWDAYYKAAGRPDTAEGYEFDELPEELKNDDFQKGMKELLHKAGTGVKEAKILEQGFNELVKPMAAKAKGDSEAVNKAADEAFDTMTADVFGDKKEDALKQSRALIDANTSDKVKPFIGGLSNEALTVMADVLNNVAGKYIKPDQLPTGGAGVGPNSPEEKREEGRKLMASKAYNDPFDPAHKSTVAKVQELYGTNQK